MLGFGGEVMEEPDEALRVGEVVVAVMVEVVWQ